MQPSIGRISIHSSGSFCGTLLFAFCSIKWRKALAKKRNFSKRARNTCIRAVCFVFLYANWEVVGRRHQQREYFINDFSRPEHIGLNRNGIRRGYGIALLIKGHEFLWPFF
ncbi:hypothetical protein CEXT_208911 [Caerostris extrusa]|uniref:Secreted protein n=1 Tax=Caerostris extrusa TaxID=172846 RepID=A0AAV4MW86_CAEEX|nr:hypothetical protein CEXT_208911 [Caerostris extrusa]